MSNKAGKKYGDAEILMLDRLYIIRLLSGG